MIDNTIFLNMTNSPVRAFRGRVEVYNGSTLALICGCHDRLKEFTVERTGENKFFGYGICQKLNVKLLDVNRDLTITTANSLEVEMGIDTNYLYPFPKFFVTEVHRDETTNELSITAYDALYKAANYTVSELGLSSAYTIGEFATACAAFLGLPVDLGGVSAFGAMYEAGANFDGTESLREALNAIAEATQTIYFINNNWVLTFKQLSNNAPVDLVIDKEKYFALDSGANKRLAKIVHATELGDNVAASTSASGSTQYVRNNPFWELREDIATLLNNAVGAVGGLTINQFNCTWRGNPLLEIGDKISLVTKDNNSVISYLLNDTFVFNGSLSQSSEWSYIDDESESETNAVTLGDALKQTYARVDKANRQIELVASEASNNINLISSLQLSTNDIAASVKRIEESANTAITELNGELQTLTKEVSAKMDSEQLKVEIQSELANGTSKVVTSTGFTFDETGLTVSKSGSEMNTQITEDGMQVFKSNQAVLTANNAGVNAVNLHATTYLIIGENSRLEDYTKNGSKRTGCFFIGS